MDGNESYHGITQEQAAAQSVDSLSILTSYQDNIESHVCKLGCHNVDFDKRVVESELSLADVDIADVETYCAMEEAADFCELLPQTHGQYKWPKLDELHKELFEETMQHPYNSDNDVMSCAECNFAFKDRQSQ